MRDTNLIEDSDVAVEVLKATLSDESYGYLSECTKRSIGAEYERRLKRHLRKLNISFQVSIIYNQTIIQETAGLAATLLADMTGLVN